MEKKSSWVPEEINDPGDSKDPWYAYRCQIDYIEHHWQDLFDAIDLELIRRRDLSAVYHY